MDRRMGALVSCVTVAVSGCASTNVTRMANDGPDGGEYRIAKEDVLEVVVYREPELSRVVPVRPDGRISLPLAGEMEAAGKTPSELQRGIVQGLTPYVHDATVAVLVKEINGSKVFVLGEVVHPGEFPLRGPMSVVQAIAVAGGRTPYAGDRIVWLRQRGAGNTDKATLSFDELMKGEAQGGLWLKGGDILYVP
ncbi:MAG TPA: polysaccharide biosynthesis/export family protein [Anaeromyxobacter sp.]|nr:polysaccharide biosynthesis/export family protein [Anaeromyxobacter sp.]